MSFLVWFIIGLVLLAVEMVTGTFFLMFFGFSGLLVAASKLVGLENLLLECLAFAVLGVVGVLVLRKPLLARRSNLEVPSDQGQTLVLSCILEPGESGTSSYQGSPWTVVNSSNETLNVGTEVRIVRTEGIRLFVTRN